MPKKITVVDIDQEPLPENKEAKEVVVVDEVANVVDEVANVVDDVVDDVADKVVKTDKKMITCPDCNKTMLERNFRSKHIKICGKPKVPKAKPIEELVEEKKIVQQPIATPKAKPKAKAKPRAKTQPIVKQVVTPPTEQPTVIEPRTDYWESRRQHLNLLNEKKAVTVRKIMAKAF
jgi:ssDNA-binding Zn-finger/Zn-ribbon topoisomerase 1